MHAACCIQGNGACCLALKTQVPSFLLSAGYQSKILAFVLGFILSDGFLLCFPCEPAANEIHGCTETLEP